MILEINYINLYMHKTEKKPCLSLKDQEHFFNKYVLKLEYID